MYYIYKIRNIILLIPFLITGLAHAQTGEGNPVNLELKNPIKADNLIELLKEIVDIAMFVAIPIIVLAIIYAGFLFIKAQGNPKDLEDAKKTLLYVIIGAAIILGSKLLIEIISGTIGSIGDETPTVDL